MRVSGQNTERVALRGSHLAGIGPWLVGNCDPVALTIPFSHLAIFLQLLLLVESNRKTEQGNPLMQPTKISLPGAQNREKMRRFGEANRVSLTYRNSNPNPHCKYLWAKKLLVM